MKDASENVGNEKSPFQEQNLSSTLTGDFSVAYRANKFEMTWLLLRNDVIIFFWFRQLVILHIPFPFLQHRFKVFG